MDWWLKKYAHFSTYNCVIPILQIIKLTWTSWVAFSRLSAKSLENLVFTSANPGSKLGFLVTLPQLSFLQTVAVFQADSQKPELLGLVGQILFPTYFHYSLTSYLRIWTKLFCIPVSSRYVRVRGDIESCLIQRILYSKLQVTDHSHQRMSGSWVLSSLSSSDWVSALTIRVVAVNMTLTNVKQALTWKEFQEFGEIMKKHQASPSSADTGIQFPWWQGSCHPPGSNIWNTHI